MKKILFWEIKKAFTLAEVLITLGVIGIVAMTVIPIVSNQINDIVLEAQFKKYDTILRDTLKKAAYDNGGSLNGYNLVENVGDYLKLLKNCSLSQGDDYSCWHDDNVVKAFSADGSSFYYKSSTQKTVNAAILIDGALLRFPRNKLDCDFSDRPENFYSSKDGTTVCITRKNKKGWCPNNFYVDINGTKGPNVYTKDVKEFWLWQDGYMRWSLTGSATNLEYIRYQDFRRLSSGNYNTNGVCEEYKEWAWAGYDMS